MKPGRDVTKTRRILEFLSKVEFARRATIVAETKIPLAATAGILNTLRRYKAVDVVIENDGVGWWFATPETDLRTKLISEQKTDIKRTFAHRRRTGTAKAIKS